MNPSEQGYIRVHVRPYTATGLAKIYGVNRKTMKTWIKKIESEVGERTGYFYTPRQVRVIFTKLTLPEVIFEYDSIHDIRQN